jgi:hypothetical protein
MFPASQAGMIILTEAGGYFTGGKASFERGTDDLGKIMMSRRYCCIRAVPPTDVRCIAITTSLSILFG